MFSELRKKYISNPCKEELKYFTKFIAKYTDKYKSQNTSK